MSKTLDRLRDALWATGLVQPVSQSCKGGKLEFLCRQIPGQEGPWLKTIDKILQLSESLPDFDKMVHICRRYVRRDSRMVFGWHIGLDAGTTKNLMEVINQLLPILETSKPILDPVIPVPQNSNLSIRMTTETAPSTPTIRVIRSDMDEEGKRHVIQEMPLPHVYQELNIPNSKGRGAERTTARTHRNS